MKLKLFFIVVLLIIGTTQLLFSQTDVEAQLQQLRNEITQLRSQLDSLKNQTTSESFGESDVERLEERLDERIQELEKKIDAGSRASSSTILNPRTTAFINLAARYDNKSVLDYEGVAEISNRPYLRSLELDFRQAVDPYADAVAIIAIEDEAGTGYAVEPEEVYGVIKRLPLLESAPLGLKVKMGQFRAPFGVSNKIHMHDLPWTTRPLIVSKYLGTEHGDFFESGFNPVGVDFDFFLPNFLTDVTKEVNFSIVRGEEFGLPSDISTDKTLGYVGHLNISKDWDNEHLLNLGLSFYGEGNFLSNKGITEADDKSLLGIDFTYKWAPAENRESKSLVLGGEFMQGSQLLTDSVKGITRNNPFGWYGYVQYQTSSWLYLGARYDWLEEPTLEKPVTQSFAAYASYYTSEYFRLRLGYEQRWSDIEQVNALGSLLFEVNFVFGSHPTEPYWVNR
ncbi:MAG: hypothetical protein HY960_02785 [Ignavibacteriae bacterium]|nr:hypothetical protein [Ignavibacteriota bacterium]